MTKFEGIFVTGVQQNILKGYMSYFPQRNLETNEIAQ